MPKQILTAEKAKLAVKRGIDLLANTVKMTLGPKGRNVILGKSFGAPQITNDGVTIAKEIELEDKFENLGAELAKEVASKTNDAAETKILSKVAFALYPMSASWQMYSTIPLLMKLYFDRFFVPNFTTLETISSAMTLPLGPTITANKALAHPEPAPTSSIRSPSCGFSSSSINATTLGWEIVWFEPIESASSKYAKSFVSSCTKSFRSIERNASMILGVFIQSSSSRWLRSCCFVSMATGLCYFFQLLPEFQPQERAYSVDDKLALQMVDLVLEYSGGKAFCFYMQYLPLCVLRHNLNLQRPPYLHKETRKTKTTFFFGSLLLSVLQNLWIKKDKIVFSVFYDDHTFLSSYLGTGKPYALVFVHDFYHGGHEFEYFFGNFRDFPRFFAQKWMRVLDDFHWSNRIG